MEQTVSSVYDSTPMHSLISIEGMWEQGEDCKNPRSRPEQFVVEEVCGLGGSLTIWELLMEDMSGLLEAYLKSVSLGVTLQNFLRARERCTCVRCCALGT